MLMDSIFGPGNFRNEVVWKRTHAHGSSRRFGPVNDIIMFYSKSDDFKWKYPREPHSEQYIKSKFTYKDPGSDRLYQPIVLTGSGIRNGSSGMPWRSFNPTAKG